MNLRCAVGLPGMNQELVGLGIDKINEWTDKVEDFTRKTLDKFRGKKARFTEAQIRVGSMIECLQRVIGIQYNFDFMNGEYNVSDSRKLFIHGVLTGSGGTCASLPVVYCAIGRRLRYPIFLATTEDHCFCRWDGEESFCFETASQGFLVRPEEYYRTWPHHISRRQEKECGYIRPLTTKEEMAMFAGNRSNCLMDNFQFLPAVEAMAFAHQLVPGNLLYDDGNDRAIYTAMLWQEMQKLRQLHQSISIEDLVHVAASELRGPDINLFRPDVVKNMHRIIDNYETHRQRAKHEAAIQTL